MSDTSAPVAPPQAPQAPQQAPQTAPGQVPINPSPVNQPNPVGPQAPERPQEQRSQTARDAVQAAFERAKNPPQRQARAPADNKPPAKPAEAKAGHNNPPEETPKLDLKKRPEEQQARPRGERGQFAPRPRPEGDAKDNIGTQTESSNRILQGQSENRLPPHAPYRDPPPRISERARQDWDTAPESVRGDYHRLHQEAEGIHRHYKGVAEAYQPIAQFDQMARQHGTTLQKALGNYVSMEAKLRADPVAGLDVIVNNLNLRAPNGQKLGLRDIAYHILSQSPERVQQLQLGNQQVAAHHQIGALHQEINGLKQHLHQMHTQQQFNYTRSAVDQFATTHPRFDELGGLIERELKLGFDLETAYRRAELLQPATHAAQTRNTSAQTRDSTDRSIHGSPDVAPSNGALRKTKDASRSPRDAVQNAMARLNSMQI